jgi:UDP-N-acetylglucosamine transferase subunit ALG13
MIFASVGSMLPFDRLVRTVDEWAQANPSEPVYIQIGDGEYEPKHAPFVRMMPHTEYRQRLEDSTLFVAHVGMGSILQSLEARKQLLMLPRLAALREHTTDHQLHTAARFRDTEGLLIVNDTDALKAAMSRLLRDPLAPSAGISRFAPQQMIDNVAQYLTARSTQQ